MQITYSQHDLTPPKRGTVLSIGVFDGVHLGHRAILDRNVELARELGAVPTVVTFRSHPKLLLLGRAPRTLTSLEHRLELFARAGIEHTVALEFDEGLRALSAAEFAGEVAIQGLGARCFVLGFDSKFGHDRRGTPDYLRELGYTVEVVDKVKVGDRAVSSTAIREAVELGDLNGAGTMLGRAVTVMGDVVKGERLGHTIGFPTANLDLHHELHPPPGVYAGLAHRLLVGGGRETHPAVANIGYRPTVAETKPSAPRLEVHLLDFEGDLYGQRLEFEFVRRLRGEQRFEGLDALKAQIARDVETARKVLANPLTPPL